jgi:methylamine utilization protein MauE
MTRRMAPSSAAIANMARCLAAAGFVALAALKIANPASVPAESHGLADVLASPTISRAATAVELCVGVGLLTPWRRAATLGAGVWLAVLAGVIAAFWVGDIPYSHCGCLGANPTGLPVRVAIVAGLAVLTYVGTGDSSTSADGVREAVGARGSQTTAGLPPRV